jgi:hypothetical protein
MQNSERKSMLRSILGFTAILTLGSCSHNAKIDSAYAVNQSDGRVLVYIKTNVDELNRIIEKEYYFSIVITECDTKSEIYPVRPYIDGIPASRFPVAKTGLVYGAVPRHIYEEARRPCAYLRGGSYLSGKIRSRLVPIELR